MASLAKMNALSDNLRASLPESDDVKPQRTTSPQHAQKRTAGKDIGRGGATGGDRPRRGIGGQDPVQLQLDYDEVRSRYEELLRENESLKTDQKRRIESSVRRQKKYETEVDELRKEISRQATGSGPSEASMSRLRSEHKLVLERVNSLKANTASVLAEQERDLLRAFRARLYDVQIELERERSRKDDGALEWIEKSRSLSKELDWSREEALRLDRLNQSLTKESSRLKTQLASYEDDRELLVRQMLALKKENARLKRVAEEGGTAAVLSGAVAGAGHRAAKPGGHEGLELMGDLGEGTAANSESMASRQRLKEVLARQSESEARARETISRLKRLLEVERRNLRAVRMAHARDLQSRTELEGLLRACTDDVVREIANHRAAVNGSAPPPPGVPVSRDVAVASMAAADRERVLELLLSQERVVTLLYQQTFPPRPIESDATLIEAIAESGDADPALDDLDDGLPI